MSALTPDAEWSRRLVDPAAMAVVGPMATGMGGDAFLLFYEAGTGRVLGANGSGAAPKAAGERDRRRTRGLSGEVREARRQAPLPGLA